jgi:hypothetical protein
MCVFNDFHDNVVKEFEPCRIIFANVHVVTLSMLMLLRNLILVGDL